MGYHRPLYCQHPHLAAAGPLDRNYADRLGSLPVAAASEQALPEGRGLRAGAKALELGEHKTLREAEAKPSWRRPERRV